eukprot:c16766_g1_i3 orf=377-583(+)
MRAHRSSDQVSICAALPFFVVIQLRIVSSTPPSMRYRCCLGEGIKYLQLVCYDLMQLLFCALESLFLV